jgi:DNA primase
MGAEKATGYVDNLFDRAKAVRFESLLDRLGISVQKHGEELRGICPIPAHSGEKKKPSFYVNPDKQVFNCFGCKAKGNIVTFAQAYTGLATFESKQAALWIIETMHDDEAEHEAQQCDGENTEQDESDDEILVKLFTVAGEQLITLIAKHVNNPKPLAERLARWLVEGLKT